MASRITNDWTQSLISHIESRSASKLAMLGEKVVSRARALVPVRTGQLQKSIHAEILKTRVKIIADARTHSPGSNVSYAYWVETGTGRGPAQPFLVPALMSVTNDIKIAFKDWQF